MTNVQEQPLTLPAVALAQPRVQERLSRAAAGTPRTAMADGIRRIGPIYRSTPADAPPGNAQGSISGPMGIVSQLLGIITELISVLGMGGIANGLFGNSQGAEQYFQNAAGSSTGDPHLSFNGSHFDSMSSHADLLDSDSFAGGYEISTGVTQPNANGVTYNRQATVSTDFGGLKVSLDNAGNATVCENGMTFALAEGQSVDLGAGETVTRSAAGSLAIVDANGMGGSVTTTLTQNGQGVDVNITANDVDLGGDLVTHRQQPQLRLTEPLRF